MRTKVYWVLLISFMACQCGSFLGKRVETRTVWESEGRYIRLFREVDGNRGYDQPAHFHEGDMQRILLSMYFAKYEFFRWGGSTRVFEEAQARDLAPFFQRAFLEAGPEDVVEFYLPIRAKKLFGASGQTLLTRGRAFVKGEHLSFRFDSIRQPIVSHAAKSDDEKPLPPTAWKLVPQEGQAYGREAGPIGPEGDNDHWLVISLGAGTPPGSASKTVAPPPAVLPANQPGPGTPRPGGEHPSTPPGPTPAAPPSQQAATREKLRDLRQMLEEGLITQQDYDLKKKEILEGF